MIFKQPARVVIRLIKAFLAEEPPVVEDNYNCGDPPFTYEDANRFFKKILKDGDLQRSHYVWGALQGVNLAQMMYMAHIFDHNLYPRYDGLVRQATLDLRTEPA